MLHVKVTPDCGAEGIGRGIVMLKEPGSYDYLPLVDRPRIQWPNGARVAFWVCPNIEFYELAPPDGQGRPLWPRPFPDVLNYSLRDYGNRSGVWRVMEALERFGVSSVSLNAAMCDHMPDIVYESIGPAQSNRGALRSQVSKRSTVSARKPAITAVDAFSRFRFRRGSSAIRIVSEPWLACLPGSWKAVLFGTQLAWRSSPPSSRNS